MSPRRVIPLAAGVAVVLLAAHPAAAQTAEDDERAARAVANVVVTALATGEAGVLASSIRAPLEGDVTLRGACGKKFKYGVRVTRAKLAAYSRCLVSLELDLRGGEVVVLPDAPGLVIATNNDAYNLRLKLRRVKKEWKVVELGVQDLAEDDGVEGGVVGGVYAGPRPPPAPPPPPPPPPNVVPPVALESQRIAGDKNILADRATRDAMVAAGKEKVVVPVKLCIDKTGAVESTRVLKTSGFAEYDAKLATTIRDTWKYKPFLVNGTATPVCSVVTFIYTSTP